MDIATIFEVLSEGTVISYNSSKYADHVRFLLDEELLREANEAISTIGFEIIGKNGYFYMAKKGYLDSGEINAFITKHKQIILAISILRQLYPRIDRGETLTFLATAGDYDSLKKNDITVKEKLKTIATSKTINDEKAMLEKMFKLLEDNDIIERIDLSSSDRFKVLDAIEYYMEIVEVAESQGGKNA